MTILWIVEILGEFISASLLIYFFNKLMIPKNKKYSKMFSVIMIITYTLISILLPCFYPHFHIVKHFLYKFFVFCHHWIYIWMF